MKFLVTGICGRLGRALAVEATAQGHGILGIDRLEWPAMLEKPRGVETLVGSYEDMAFMKTLLGSCDALIHTAGPNGEHVKQLSLAGFLRANVESVASMLETAVQAGVKHAVLSSTMEVLLGRNWDVSGAAVVDENSLPQTDSAYSVSRLLAEVLGREFARRNPISIASLRYMAFGYGKSGQLGPSLLARSLTSEDTARATIRAAMVEGLKGDVFNIGPKTPVTNEDILVAFSRPELIFEKYFPGSTAILAQRGIKSRAEHFWPATKIDKARQILGWEPVYTFEHWLIENGWKK